MQRNVIHLRTRVKRERAIYERMLPSGNISFCVDMEKVNGQRLSKDFGHPNEALKLKVKSAASIEKKYLGSF